MWIWFLRNESPGGNFMKNNKFMYFQRNKAQDTS